MIPITRIIAVTLIALSGCKYSSYAQADSTDIDDFIPRETVIFYDDFSGDKADVRPALWHIKTPSIGQLTFPQICYVSKEGQQAMVMKVYRDSTVPITPVITSGAEPIIKEKDYLPDSFTLQYDIQMGSTGTDAILVLRPGCYIRMYAKDDSEWTIEGTYFSGTPIIRSARMPEEVQDKKWFHFALSFYKRKITCYINDETVLTLYNYNGELQSFALSVDRTGSVSYANVRLATGASLIGEHYNFSKLFMADKFTTHAIHFDVKKSTIQPGSITFIKKLAGWLKQNPTVKLEIDGHTDNDGKDADNMKLSQERADEVKKQLVAYGINTLRITTKGYGATIPVQSNSSPEGKAYNRRVEFIKR